ncbi:MAG: UshA-like (seleno)protein [Myxococcota bacterium]
MAVLGLARALPVLGLLFTTACKADGAAQASSGAREAVLFFSTEVSGYIEPCGCTSKPLGGIQRLARVVLDEKLPHAVIDAGDLLFPSEPITEATREQHVLKARLLARMYRQLGAAAINLGPTELAGGAELLKDLQREGAVPFVSANVRPVGDRGPSVAQSFLRELGGIKIGLTGVATPETMTTDPAFTALEYAPPLKAEIALLKKRGAELIVVLAHVGAKEAQDLAALVPEVDVLIRAPGTPIGHAPAAPERVGGVLVLEAGSQGQHVGRLRLRLPAGAITRPLALDDGGARQKQQNALVERKIRALEQEVETLKADPKNAEAVTARQTQLVELKKKLEAPARPEATGEAFGLKVDLVPLTEEVKGEPNAVEVLGAYYSQLKSMNAKKGDLSLCKYPPEAPHYVGSEACKTCHEPAYAFWTTTKHSQAWATLENQGKHFDLTCIGCHSVAYQTPGGYCRLDDIGVLKNVGCEMCHGPGSAHAVAGDKKSVRRGVTESTCASACHVPAHSDTFEFRTYLSRITGPGHRLGAGS